MCERCADQMRRLQNRLGIGSGEAFGIMLEFTAYPVADPDYVGAQVDEIVAEVLVNHDALP
jgi:hypothetical protein